MAVALLSGVFAMATAVSLAVSYLLVTRLERIGARFGLSEAMLGVLAALAGNAPEITSATTALIRHQQKLGAGVIIGSNVFNLAALLGLGGVVAGRIAVHRRVVLMNGAVGVWIAAVCLIAVLGAIGPVAGLALVLVVLAPYLVVLGAGHAHLGRLPVARRWEDWLAVAIHEEEQELTEAIHPRRGHLRDGGAAGAALIVVIAASVTMEQTGARIGEHFGLPEIITGGVVLAAVTSLPNAVAAVYLAARGRGAAMLSTTLNSNALNVTAGLLVPASFIGLGPPSPQSDVVAVWYLVLTLAALALAYRHGGVSRASGSLVIVMYLVFLGSLLVTAGSPARHPGLIVISLIMVVAAGAAALARRPPADQPSAGSPAGPGDAARRGRDRRDAADRLDFMRHRPRSRR